MIDPVSVHLEAAIYLYFVLVAGVGCYFHVRLWLASRRSPDYDDGANPN
ncbi:hypothetical protein [Salinadaptatus halalkaliphilus]|nr:hypothetical protein [Salinadaptatus halalkaliphilus]